MKTLFIKLRNFAITNPNHSLFLILALTIASYINVFPNQFVMDDYDFIVDWPLVQDWNNALRFFVFYIPPDGQIGIYSPLKTVFHSLTYHLFGQNPLGYHFVSLMIHSTAIVFVYKISFLLVNKRWIAFLAALFFALHPVNAEPVISMTGSIDIIGIVFLFISFYFYLKFIRSSDKKSEYVFSLIFAFLAIFTHELVISLPILFLFYDYFFNEKREGFKQVFLRVLPYFVIVLFYVLAKFFVLGAITRGGYLFDSFYLTILVTLKSLGHYVRIVFFPFVLTVNHIISKGIFSYDAEDFDKFAVLSQSIWDIPVLASIGLIGAIIFVAFKIYTKDKVISFCIGWFLISLIPVLNIIPSSVYFAERYLYPGLFGFCLLCAIVLDKFGEQQKRQALCMGIVILLMVFYSSRVIWRSFDWRNEVTFYESCVRANPASAFLHRDLGLTYLRAGQPYKALYYFQKAAQLKSDNAEIYFSLANGYRKINDVPRATKSLEKAVAIKPDYAEGYYNLATLYAYSGRGEAAITTLNKSLENFEKQGKILEAYEGREAFLKYFYSAQDNQQNHDKE